MLIRYNRNKSKLLSVLLLLLPIFNMYGLSGGRGTIADFALIFMFVLVASKSIISQKIKIETSLMIFALFLFLDGAVTMAYTNAPFSQHITYTLRYMSYFIIFAIGFKNFLDINFTMKLYGAFCILSTIWLLLQYVLMVFFKIYLPGFIAEFVTREELLTDYSYVNYTSFYRPRSFFEEPAHYATYVVGYLIVLLLTSDTSKQIMLKIFLSVGIVVSGSTTGLIMMALGWAFCLGKLFRKKRVGIKILFLLVGLLGALYVALQSSTAQILIRRTFQSNEASSGRFKNVMMALNSGSAIEFFFGRGAYVPAITDDLSWLPGWPLIYKCFGILGFLILLGALFMMFVRASRSQKVFLVLFVILNIGTEMITMSFIFPYMAYIVCGAELENTVSDSLRIKGSEIRADVVSKQCHAS